MTTVNRLRFRLALIASGMVLVVGFYFYAQTHSFYSPERWGKFGFQIITTPKQWTVGTLKDRNSTTVVWICGPLVIYRLPPSKNNIRHQ